MRKILSEYGKVAVAAAAGILAMIILFREGAVTDALKHLRPDSPQVKNEEAARQLAGLQKREKPLILLNIPAIELGDTFQTGDLVAGAIDAEGKDLREDIECFLEDGTKVDLNFSITVKELKVYRFRFRVEDALGLYTERTCMVAVRGNTEVPEAEHFEESWEFGGSGSDSVTAKIFLSGVEEGGDNCILLLDGSGNAKSVTSSSQSPWREYSSRISECVIADTVETPDISWWFYDCTVLKKVPELKTVTYMKGAFYGCKRLLTGSIPKGVREADYAFYNCSSMRACTVQSNVLEKMNYLFYNCRKLRGKLVIGSKPSSYTGCFGHVGTNTGGIPLKIYAADAECVAAVSQMVNEELENTERNSNLIYKGIAG